MTISADQTVQPRGTVSSSNASGDGTERDGGGRHLHEGEREDVEAVRVPLDHHDVEGLHERADQDEQVSPPGALRNTREEGEPDERERDSGPQRPRDRRPEEGQAEQRREQDVQARDEARAGHRCPLEARGLQPDPECDQAAEDAAGDEALAAEPSKPAQRDRGERRGRDHVSDGEERKERVELHRVLDLHERDAPDRRDEDQRGGRHLRSLETWGRLRRGNGRGWR